MRINDNGDTWVTFHILKEPRAERNIVKIHLHNPFQSLRRFPVAYIEIHLKLKNICFKMNTIIYGNALSKPTIGS